jgi:hypothetical protein
MAEWGIRNPLNEPYTNRKGLPNFRQVCTDGDPTCDLDGLANGVCEIVRRLRGLPHSLAT